MLFKSSKAPSTLKCGATDIKACGENDKPDSLYSSDEASVMCAFRAGVESCSVSKLFSLTYIFLNFQLIFLLFSAVTFGK